MGREERSTGKLRNNGGCRKLLRRDVLIFRFTWSNQHVRFAMALSQVLDDVLPVLDYRIGLSLRSLGGLLFQGAQALETGSV
jgi:hypothetical protein